MARRFYDSVLAFTLIVHLAALVGVVRDAEGHVVWAALIAAALVFIVVVVKHPAKRAHSQGYTLTWGEVFRGVSKATQVTAVTAMLWGFGISVAAIATAEARETGTKGVSSAEVGPIGVSAFALGFTAVGWLAGLSGLARKQAMVEQGTWFR